MCSKVVKIYRLVTDRVFLREAVLYRIPAAVEHLNILKYTQPKHLIDVGANKGQFALAAYRSVDGITIDCFEPLSGPAERLEKWAKRTSSNIRLHRVALSDRSSLSEFMVTSREDSSSLFRPTEDAKELSDVQLVSQIQVQCERLDSIITVDDVEMSTMLKIDVQGNELNVLKGATAIIRYIKYIYIEVSFMELYENQPLFGDIDNFLREFGFSLRGVGNCYTDAEFGPTQADILYQNDKPMGAREKE